MVIGKTNMLSEAINETVKSNDYLPFVPLFSKEGTVELEVKVSRLFDETPEQLTHGTAPWDNYGWSRDGWVF